MSEPDLVLAVSVFARVQRDVVVVEGPDAAAYLQGQLSQDVAALAVGQSASTFVLAPQGKVEGWGRVTRRAPDHFEVLVDAGAGPAWEARLRRFLLRTKAEIEVRPGVDVVAVRGPGSNAAVGAHCGRDAGWPGMDGADVVGADTDLDDVVTRLRAEGFVEANPDQLDALRISAGVPRWGAELDPDTIPAAAGQWVIDSSVSFTKGCYTGQELVARVDSRGGNVPRLLHRLVVQGPAPAPGTPVMVEGAEVGAVTSSADAFDGIETDLEGAQGSVALAWVARAHIAGDAGEPAEVGGHPARLLPPPTTSTN
jgi:folate-binding protein YgfZ